jgi:glycosyltransferase involved in cell wall biosynthesis
MVGEKVAGAESSWASSVVDAAERSGVRYRGRVDVPQELAEWDVFVLPSRRDSFPLAVLEAMSMAIPVVATRVDGVREQLEPDAGLLVAPEDAHALASAIARLAKDPTLRASLGVAGRHRVEERFTLDRQAEALHRTYVAVRSARRGTVERSGRRRAA